MSDASHRFPSPGPDAYVAAGGPSAPSVRRLLDERRVPPVLDPEGVAAWLQRGAPLASRLPVRGVRDARPLALPPPVPAEPSTLWDALVASVRASGARAVWLGAGPASALLALAAREGLGPRVEAVVLRPHSSEPRPEGDVERTAWALGLPPRFAEPDPQVSVTEALLEWEGRHADLPSVGGFACAVRAAATARAVPGAVVLSALGGAELFGEGREFEAFAEPPSSLPLRRRRPKEGGDPLDVDRLRAAEVAAFARVDAQRIASLTALLPAATRAALSRTGPRPPEGIDPGSRGLALASDLLWSGRAADAGARDLDAVARAGGVGVVCPFLDPAVVAEARGLDPAARFGVPGSGGAAAALVASRRVPVASSPPEDFEHTLTAWLRGPLAPWLDRALARERVGDQGILVPDAVAEARARFARGVDGWTGKAVYALAVLSGWVERCGLALPQVSP